MMAKRDGNTREQIVEAAMDLFSVNGVAGVSIRDITKRVGINESSLYNHFGGKAELLDAIIENFQHGFGEAIYDETQIEFRLAGVEPEQFFVHHLLDLRSRITPQVIKMWKIVYMEMFRDKRARDFVLQELLGRPLRYYEKVFTMLMAQGKVKPLDPKLLAHELEYGLFGNSIERMLLQTDEADIAPVVQRLFAHLKFLCDSIKPE